MRIGAEGLVDEQTLALKCQTCSPALPLYKNRALLKSLFIRVAIPIFMLNLYLNLVYSEHKTKDIAAARL